MTRTHVRAGRRLWLFWGFFVCVSMYVGALEKKKYTNVELKLCVTAASCRQGARVREKLGHHLLLVPPGAGHLRQHLRRRRPQLEDDPGPAGRLDSGLPGHDQGDPVVGEGKAALRQFA